MKKKTFIIAAVAASLVATPVLAAPVHQDGPRDRDRIEQNDRHDHRPQMQRVAHTPTKAQHWNKGDRFDSRRAANYRVIDNPRSHHLHDAPRGYRWVQSNNDAVLVGIASGIIAAVVANGIN